MRVLVCSPEIPEQARYILDFGANADTPATIIRASLDPSVGYIRPTGMRPGISQQWEIGGNDCCLVITGIDTCVTSRKGAAMFLYRHGQAPMVELE